MKAVALQIQSFCSAILFVLLRNINCFARQFQLICAAILFILLSICIYFTIDSASVGMRIGAFRQGNQSVWAMGNHSDGIPERGRFTGRSNQTGAGNHCLTGASFPQFSGLLREKLHRVRPSLRF
jgi:hypothetical protein